MLFLFSKTHTFLRAHHFFRPTLDPLPFSTFTKEITLAKRVFSELQPKPNQPNDSEHLLTRGMIKGQVWVGVKKMIGTGDDNVKTFSLVFGHRGDGEEGHDDEGERSGDSGSGCVAQPTPSHICIFPTSPYVPAQHSLLNSFAYTQVNGCLHSFPMLPALAATKPSPLPWRIGRLIRVPLLGIGISSAPTSASGRFEIRVRFRQRQGNDQVSSPSPSDNAHGIDVQIFTSRLQAPTQGNLYALLCISGFTIPHNRRRRHRQNPDVLTVMLVTLVTPVTHTKSERPNDLNIVATPTHCALLTKLTVAIDGYYLYPGWSRMASKLLVLEIFRWFGFWMTKPTMAASALGPSAFALRLSVKHPTSYILLLSLISKTPLWHFVSLATI
ncbi:hypothetical protein D9758_004922 [Tetrapyrgos nigripes]|uniref:Uncharacterized protein n=1 Tax=Tetrapyrgos nigripes TaxID=182062 RepID=A0A8H5GW23_9AGAR|nr:hypothetical protein D9758_004922 [Tetrapyrgos nigripes]